MTHQSAMRWLALFLVCIAAGQGWSADVSPYRSETAEALKHVLPGAGAPLPKTLFPPSELEAKRARANSDPTARERVRKAATNADRWLEIPKDAWAELIPDRSPAPICDYPNKGASEYLTADPLNGARKSDEWFEPIDLLQSPFRIRSVASGEWVYEREEDAPGAYAYPVKGYVEIPHWGGNPRKLAFAESAGLRFDGLPMRYYPANLVWKERLNRIIGGWDGGVVPDLTDAYLETGDEKYAGQLVAVLERLAQVFPHMPLAYYNGLDDRYSRDAFLEMAGRHESVGWHGWLGCARLSAAETNFRAPSEAYKSYLLARAFMAVENSSVWSNGEVGAQLRREFVRRNLLGELALLLHSYGAHNCVGNGIGMYAPGLLGLGVALQDRYLFDGYNVLLEEFMYNENYYDGISIEGSLNYAGMVSGMWRLLRDRAMYEPDFLKRHPFAAVCGKSKQRLSSLWGVPSQHGDGPNEAYLAAAGPRNGPSGAEAREPSAVFGGFGISLLRCGDPGRRLELFLHHDRAVGHAHPDMLGLQLHYRGAPIISFIGDARWGRFIDLRDDHNRNAAALRQLAYPRPMVVSEDKDYEGWAYELNGSSATKNTMLVDEYGYGGANAPWRGGMGTPKEPYGNLVLFKAGEDPDSDDAGVQMAEAIGENVLPLHYQGMRVFRRTVICVTRPDGRPYALDVFHATGGDRKLLLWHSQGEPVENAIPAGGEVSPNLEEWLTKTFPNRYEWSAPTTRMDQLHRISGVRVQQRPAQVWRHAWRLDYAQWASQTAPDGQPAEGAAGRRAQGMTPVNLRLHGISLPGLPATHLVNAKSVLPAIITEYVDGRRCSGMVRFKDGLDFVGLMNAGSVRSSFTFVHVLEPFNDGELAEIEKIETLSPASGDHRLPNGAAGLMISFTDKTKDLIALLPAAAGAYAFREGFSLQGRLGMVRLGSEGDVREARLISGTRLAYQGRSLVETVGTDLAGIVLRLEGDLSGDRGRSSMLIRPDCAWPAATALAGRIVTAAFNQGSRSENYVIAEVLPVDDGLQRVVLRDAPPFADLFGKVQKTGGIEHDPELLQEANEFIGTRILKGAAFGTTPYLAGSRVAFPSLGLEFTLKNLEGRPGRYDLAEPVNLAEIGVQQGTPFVVFPDFRGAVVRVVGESGFRIAPDGARRVIGR